MERLSVHSFRTLPADPGTITRNTVEPCLQNAQAFRMITRPTSLQERALDWLGPLMGREGPKRARSAQTYPVKPPPEKPDLFRIGDVR